MEQIVRAALELHKLEQQDRHMRRNTRKGANNGK